MPSRTILVQQDHFRFILNPAGGGREPNLSLIQEMIKHNTLHALTAGYDVILEGNLVRSQYSEVLDYIINNHDSDPSVFNKKFRRDTFSFTAMANILSVTVNLSATRALSEK